MRQRAGRDRLASHRAGRDLLQRAPEPEAAGARAAGRDPSPAVHEKTASDRSIQEYARMRGLLITQRETARTWPDGLGRPGPGPRPRPAVSPAG